MRATVKLVFRFFFSLVVVFVFSFHLQLASVSQEHSLLSVFSKKMAAVIKHPEWIPFIGV